jgi:uncharacterized protein
MTTNIPEFDPAPPRDWGFVHAPDQRCYSCAFKFEEHKTRKTLDGGRSFMCPDGSGHRFRADHRPKEQRFPSIAKALEATPRLEPEPESKPKRGFAAMPRDKVRELARQGGVSAHASGKAYRWNAEQAREAGRKGGLALHSKKRAAE